MPVNNYYHLRAKPFCICGVCCIWMHVQFLQCLSMLLYINALFSIVFPLQMVSVRFMIVVIITMIYRQTGNVT